MTPLSLSYGIAHFAKSVVGLSSVLIFAFFLTEIVGLSPTAMGVILAISLCFSALCDVSLGWFLRHRIVSARTAASFMVLGSILSAISFTAFAGAGLIPRELQLVYVLTTLFGFRLSYALFDLPHNTIMAFVTATDATRGSYGAIRYATAGMAIIMIALLLGVWLDTDDKHHQAIVAFYGCGSFGLLGIAGASVLFWQINRKLPEALTRPQVQNERHGQAEPVTYFTLILISIGIYSSLMASFTKLQAYFVAFTEPGSSVGSNFMIVVALGQILSQFLWAHLARMMPLLKVYRIAALSLGLVALAFLLTPYVGVWYIFGIAFLFGGASSGLLMTIWSLQAAAAKAHLGVAPQRYGQFIFVSKLAQAAALLSIGFVLNQFNFRNPENGGYVVILMATGPLITACLCSIVGWRTHLGGKQPGASNSVPVSKAQPISY
jgi:glycoside/pentoside/hexuronide:cation symporter, GPH family